jgi:alpha-tubulin suppressor-like RCC1 family protein
MYQISTGPSHSSSLSVKKTMYTWGTNETGRLGLEQKDVKRARREPTLVSFIFELMQKNR